MLETPTARASHRTPTGPPRRAPPDDPALLEFLCRTLDVEAAPGAVARMGGDVAAARPGAGSLDRLEAVCERLGLHVTAHELPFAAAREELAFGTGVALVGREGAWVGALGVDAGEWTLDGADKPVPEADVLARLGLATGDDEVLRLIVEPLAPITAAHGDDPTIGGGGGHDGHPSSRERLFAMLRLESSDLWVVTAYAIAVGLLSLGVPVAVQALVNSVAFGLLLQPLVVLTVLLFAVLALSGVMRAIQAQVVEYIQQRVFVKVAAELSDRLPRARADALDSANAPELVNRFFEVLTVQKSAATLLLDGLALALQAGIGMLLLAFYHPVLLAFDVLLIGSILFIVLVLGRRGEQTAVSESYAKYAVAAWLEELARHPHAFKTGGARAFAMERADALLRGYLRARRSHFAVVFRQMIGSFALQAFASATLLGLGGALVINGQLTLGQLVASELVVGVVLASIAKLGKQLESWFDLLAAMDKLGHLLDLPVERVGGGAAPGKSGPARLSLQQVSYAYPNGPPVLDRVTVELAPGERIGLTGPSGSGKSTLIDLLYGLRDASHGALLLDDADVRGLARDELRRAIALVRHPEIFDGTVTENVRLGRLGVSDDDVRRALASVEMLDDVGALPQGIETRLSTGGAPLSLGQARRLALARAIAGRPRILILDEVLEGLAPSARDAVIQAICAPEAPWTLIVATHVPELLARCGRVYHLDEGRLVQEAA